MQMIEDWSCEGRESGNTNILHAHSAATISQIVKSDSLRTKYKISEINSKTKYVVDNSTKENII